MTTDTRRDATLYAFQLASPRPSAEDLDEWIRRHPEYADELRGHAEALLASAQDPSPAEPSPGLLSAAGSAALAAVAARRVRPADFENLLEAAGATCQGLARKIGIGRAVLADLVQGRVRPPVPARFARAVAAALGTSVATVVAAIDASAAAPRMGFAKARGTPSAVARDFADIVRGDLGTSDRRKAYWLAPED